MKRKGWFVKGIALLSACALTAGCGLGGGNSESASVTESVAATEATAVSPSQEALLAAASEAAAPKEDWSGRYDNYFEEHPLDNVSMDIHYEEQGKKIVIRCAFANTEEIVYVKYSVWCVDDDKEIDVSEEKDTLVCYFLRNGDTYLGVEMKGKESEYYKATDMEWEQASEIAQSDNPLELGDDTFEEVKYEKEEVIDGVTYDVLSSKTLRKTQSKANRWVYTYFYVNRETQELKKLRVKDSTKIMEVDVASLDTDAIAEVPAALKSGKKIKHDQFASTFAIALVKVTFHSMGFNPDKIDWSQLAGS